MKMIDEMNFKRMFLPFLMLLMALVIVSCADDNKPVPTPERPVADFSANKTEILIDESVEFTNISTDATTYEWSFEGGTPANSTKEMPIVSYGNSGTYQVSLTAISDAGSDTKIIENYINVDVPDIDSDFDNGTDEWKIEGDANGGQADDINPQFSPVDGVDNSGHIFAEDDVAGGVWYFVAPAKYRGNKSQYFGGMLQYYLVQSNITSQFESNDIIIETSNDEAIIYRYPTDDYPGVDWTKYEIALEESAGWVNLEGEPVSNDQIKAALSNIVKLSIRGEFRTGLDTGRLDNFSFLK